MRRLALLTGLILMTSACDAHGKIDDTLYVRSEMKEGVNPATLALWDIGNNAMNDTGGIDPKLMDDKKWAELIAHAGELEAAARVMAQAQTIKAAKPGDDKVDDPAGQSMEKIQAYLDADPQTFRDLAMTLANHAAEISKAAKSGDEQKAGLLVGELDQACESCHMKYWYPEG